METDRTGADDLSLMERKKLKLKQEQKAKADAYKDKASDPLKEQLSSSPKPTESLSSDAFPAPTADDGALATAEGAFPYI